MRVDYDTGRREVHSEWVAIEHQGFARQRAEEWWRRRSRAPVPGTAEEAVELANAGVLGRTVAITVQTVPGKRFGKIVDHELETAPQSNPDTANSAA
jgi:DNA repair protein RadD